jgi:hypothetical protein
MVGWLHSLKWVIRETKEFDKAINQHHPLPFIAWFYEGHDLQSGGGFSEWIYDSVIYCVGR